jgi:hypothetical protein
MKRMHRLEGAVKEYRGSFINYVRMILAIFDPLPHVRVCKTFQTPPLYSYVRFHLVFQRNKTMLENDQLH